jgi:hypothetical protein
MPRGIWLSASSAIKFSNARPVSFNHSVGAEPGEQ